MHVIVIKPVQRISRREVCLSTEKYAEERDRVEEGIPRGSVCSLLQPVINLPRKSVLITNVALGRSDMFTTRTNRRVRVCGTLV